MDNTATYSVWMTIKITHDYFVKGSNCITIKPTPDTHKVLTRAGVIIKQSDSGTWLLLKQEGRDEIVKEGATEQLEFCLMTADSGFYYYTNNNVANGVPVWELKDVGSYGIWKMLTVYADNTLFSQKVTVNVGISSTEKFLEFLVIAKSGNRPPLTLKEDNDKLVFNQFEVDFPGEPLPVYRFITTEPVALKEAHDYKIRLWEVKENGESLLSSGLPFPKASSLSIINSQNTISSYFYF